MSDHPNGFCVKVPKRFQGLPEGIGALASSREPASLAAIERAAVEAVRNDPYRSYEWIIFGDTPLPTTTVSQRVATNPERGPLDSAELVTVQKTRYDSASWRAAKPERVKGGKLIPAQTPTIFPTERDAQQTLERYHRLGVEAGVPMAGHLAYGVVAPLSEWAATNGQPTADREREQVQAEVEVETLEVRAREAAEALERAKERVSASKPAPATSSSDWIGVPGEKGIQTRTRADGSIVYRHRGGETVDTLDAAIRDRDGQQPSREEIEAVIARAEAS